MADQTENTSDSPFEPMEKLESFLIGFINFLQHFLCTLRDLAFNQTQFSNAIKNHEVSRKYTKPVTFITLISFLATRIFRFGLLTFRLELDTFSFSKDTRTEVIPPSFLNELKIPSFTEIILYGIPTLIVVLLFSRLLKFLLVKGPEDSKKSLVSITYYSVGFQYIAYLVMFSLISLLLYSDLPDSIPDFLFDLIFFLPPLFFFWVIYIFYRLISKTVSKNDLRVSRSGLTQVWLFIWSFVLVATTTTFGIGLAYSLSQLEIPNYEAKPFLSVGLIGFDKSENNRFSVEVLVKNNSTEEIALISNQVTIYGDLSHHGEITKSSLGQAPVIILESNKVYWLKISFDKIGTEYYPGFYFYSKEDLINFVAFSPSGDYINLSAFIYSDGKIFKVSRFEGP